MESWIMMTGKTIIQLPFGTREPDYVHKFVVRFVPLALANPFLFTPKEKEVRSRASVGKTRTVNLKHPG